MAVGKSLEELIHVRLVVVVRGVVIVVVAADEVDSNGYKPPIDCGIPPPPPPPPPPHLDLMLR